MLLTYFFIMIMMIKLREKGKMKGEKTLKGKTSTTAMNKLQIQATAWSPQLSLKQMAGPEPGGLN